MSIGGDLIEIQFNNPDVGTGVFCPKAGEDSTFDTGGIRTDDDMQGIDGGGNGIYKKTRGRWAIDCTIAWDMITNEELEKMNQLALSTKETVFTITHISGTVYKGSGMIVGDVQGNGNNATIAFKASGGKEMKKVA